MDEVYKKQVSLLLEVLPVVAEEEDLALHGGTAINLNEDGSYGAIIWRENMCRY